MPFENDDTQPEPVPAPPIRPELIPVQSEDLSEPIPERLPSHGAPGFELCMLHPSSIFFDVLSNGRQNLVPAVIALLSAAKGSNGWLIFAIVIFAMSLLHTAFRYFTFRYQIQDGELTVREGLIFKRVRTVPLERIQNIDSTQKILHRIFNVAEVRVETASGKEPEAVLRVLSMSRIAELRQTVFDNKTLAADAQDTSAIESPNLDVIPEDAATEPSNENLFEALGLRNLIRAGVASNRGVLVFGVLIGAYFQFDGEQFFDPKQLFDLVPRQLGILETVYSIVVIALLFFVLTRIYGAVWYLTRFYGYRLTQVKDDFRVQCGLLTRVTATVPRNRIQFISVHQPLFMRLFGLASIRIETAGGSGMENEDATSSMGRRWFIPVIPKKDVDAMLVNLRPGLDWNPENASWVGVSEKTGRRLCRLAILESLIVAAIGLAFTRPWGWIAGVIVLPIFIYWAIRKSKAMRYSESESGVAYRSGVFTKKLSLTFFNRIQTIRLEQSPFDRRWNMASLSVDTAAAGPAEHRVHVKYLDADVARQYYRALSRKLLLK